MKKSVLLAAWPLVLAIAAMAEEGHHWSYSGGTGPGHWSAMEKDFEACGIGRNQSPIDIQTQAVRRGPLPAIAFDYKPSPLKIIDNGHTIQVNYAPGSTITINGAKYELKQFHFHKPSEEKIDGKQSDMVAHLVHKDANGKVAVVAVLLSKGAENPLIATLWKNVPKEKGHEAEVAAVTVDVNQLLPKDRGYYTFEGSLTTPPCSEGVRWFVLKSTTTVSAAEVSQFGKVYSMNARPTQPLNGREITATQ